MNNRRKISNSNVKLRAIEKRPHAKSRHQNHFRFLASSSPAVIFRRADKSQLRPLLQQNSVQDAKPKETATVNSQQEVVETQQSKSLLNPLPFNSITLGEQIGQGSFGTIFKSNYNNKDVAIKVISYKKSTNKSPADKLLSILNDINEWKLPNILPFYGYTLGVNDNVDYHFIFEYMPNGTLHDAIEKKHSKLQSWKTRYDVICHIVNGISHLHFHRIIHRDLKNLNILLDANFNAYIADFDFLVRLKLSFYRDLIVGSPLWFAPEVFDGFYTAAGDVYAVALIMWTIAVMEAEPFKGLSNYNQFKNHICDKKLRERLPDSTQCPAGIARLIDWGWKKSEDRCAAPQLLDGLRKIEQEVMEFNDKLKL